MNIVIGSGSAGVSVAMALIARGETVTMLDAGQTISDALFDRRDRFASKPPGEWSDEDIAAWQKPQLEQSEGLAMRHGSTHAQAPKNETFAAGDPFAGRASHAVGGLSNVWGAAVLPYRQQDIAAWPITTQDLAPHYQAVSQFMPISGTPAGDLQDLYPAFNADGLTPVPAGPQGEELLKRLTKNRDQLASNGIYFGPARQAVSGDCHLCGQCLHGCPWSMIYATHQTLTQLRQSERFAHRPGSVVERVSETDGNSHVHLADGSSLMAKRVFIAAGVYETAKMVLKSSPEPSATLFLQDSRQVFLPMLHRWATGSDPSTGPRHTLAKLFIEIDNADVSPFLTHSQIYSWNEFYAREMIAKYGGRIPGSGALFAAISKRLMVAQTFIHSDHCDQVELSLDSASGLLRTFIVSNPDMAPTVNRMTKALARGMSKAGLQPLAFAKRLEGPGASFHSGGTLPMSSQPGALQTDTLGRLAGFQNIHVVDASVLPSIPASTITFSVMANAHRIGTLV